MPVHYCPSPTQPQLKLGVTPLPPREGKKKSCQQILFQNFARSWQINQVIWYEQSACAAIGRCRQNLVFLSPWITAVLEGVVQGF